MLAFQISQYNAKDISVQYVDIPRPTLRPHEILIEVKAAGVNPLDNLITRGEVKLVTPYTLPLTMGNECSGVVVEVGDSVKNFIVGQKVFTRLPTKQIGAFAEYVAVPEDAVAMMPQNLNFVEAAAIPLTALTAFQALELMQPQSGQSIFISGGSGGLGAMAIPLAKARGLVVYTNGNAQSKERVTALGADKYLDYRTEDYLEHLPKVDFVLDSLGGKELERQMNLLKHRGKIVSLRGLPNRSFAQRFGLPLWKQWLFGLASWKTTKQASKVGATYDFLFVESNGKQLAEIATLIEKLDIHPSVEYIFPFAQTNKALHQVAQRGSSGKVIINFD